MEVKIGDKIRDKDWHRDNFLKVDGIRTIIEYTGIDEYGNKCTTLIDEEDLEFYKEPARSFKNTKVRVYNDELSKEVQEALFKLGQGSDTSNMSGFKYLIIGKPTSFSWNNDVDDFNSRQEIEVQAHEILEEASKL